MKTLLAVLLVSTAALSFSAKASETYEYSANSTCADAWGLSGIETQASYRNGLQKFPELTANMKKALVASCEDAKQFGEEGGDIETVLVFVSRNSNKLPEEGVKNQAFMMVSGWKIGQLKRGQ